MPGLWIRFHFLRIRIQSLMMETNTDPDPDPNPIRIQGLNDQKLKKNFNWNFFLFWSKTAIYLSLGLHKVPVCPSYRRGLQLSKEAIQHFKTWTFTNFFLLLWVFLPSWIRIRIPNPDPQTRLNTDPIRIRIHNPAECLTVLAPQHWLLRNLGASCFTYV